MKFAAVINDPVTTTDELIPSGETSSYRSNPLRLAEFTLSRKEPQYVPRAKDVQALEKERQGILAGEISADQMSDGLRELGEAILKANPNLNSVEEALRSTGIGTVIYAVKPGDGSAREQAASCQKVLGGWANIVQEYATKRYRSNLINWGMLPFTWEDDPDVAFQVDDLVVISGIRESVKNGDTEVTAKLLTSAGAKEIKLQLQSLTKDERDIILHGSLINYYAAQ